MNAIIQPVTDRPNFVVISYSPKDFRYDYRENTNNRFALGVKIRDAMTRLIPLAENANIRRCYNISVWENEISRDWLCLDRNGKRMDMAYIEIGADGPKIHASANGPDRALLEAVLAEVEV